MKLFHGSNMYVTQIDLSRSRPAKDFGRAFYLSDDREQAMEMAQFKVDTFGGEVVVNEFELDEPALDNLKCVHDYDVVYGPIANDRIGRQIFNFQSGYIDFQTFLRRIQYPVGITFQWAFCTERAIKTLRSLCI